MLYNSWCKRELKRSYSHLWLPRKCVYLSLKKYWLLNLELAEVDAKYVSKVHSKDNIKASTDVNFEHFHYINTAFFCWLWVANWLMGCGTLDSYSVRRNLFHITVKTLSNVRYGNCARDLTTIYETFRIDKKKQNNLLYFHYGIYSWESYYLTLKKLVKYLLKESRNPLKKQNVGEFVPFRSVTLSGSLSNYGVNNDTYSKWAILQWKS